MTSDQTWWCWPVKRVEQQDQQDCKPRGQWKVFAGKAPRCTEFIASRWKPYRHKKNIVVHNEVMEYFQYLSMMFQSRHNRTVVSFTQTCVSGWDRGTRPPPKPTRTISHYVVQASQVIIQSNQLMTTETCQINNLCFCTRWKGIIAPLSIVKSSKEVSVSYSSSL